MTSFYSEKMESFSPIRSCPLEIYRQLLLCSDYKTFGNLCLVCKSFYYSLTKKDKRAVKTSFLKTIDNGTERYTVLPNGKKYGLYQEFYEDGKEKTQILYGDDEVPKIEKRFYHKFAFTKFMAKFLFLTQKNVFFLCSTKTYIKKQNYYTYKEFLNNSLIKEGSYSHECKKEGIWKNYHVESNGLKKQNSYINGKKEGLSISFHPNGNKYLEGRYSNGLKEGLWVEYFKDGKDLYRKNFYKGGLRNGPSFSCSPIIKISGIEKRDLHFVGNFENDVACGLWKHRYIGSTNTVLYANGGRIMYSRSLNKINGDSSERIRIGNTSLTVFKLLYL